ncbi:MAG: flavin reductase family protein, partial [Rhizobiaceae bacterium]
MTSSTDGGADRAKPAPFWDVLGERPIGFTLVTAMGDEPVGFVGLSVAHVSAEPPLLSVALDARNKALERIERSGAFAINFLSAANEPVARAFLKKGASAAERFPPATWTTLVTGSPVLPDASGVFDCQV